MSDVKDALSQLLAVILEEVDNNKRFRERIEKALSGLSSVAEKGGVDYLLIYKEQGEDALRQAVDKLKGDNLTAVLKQYNIKGYSKLKVDEKKDKIIEYCKNNADAVLEKEELPKKIEETNAQTKLPTFDPFQVFHDSGQDVLRAMLQELDVDTLKEIIKQNRLDTRRKSTKWKDTERLIALIITRVEERMTLGSVFSKD